jgi:hypothetical protein
VVRTFGAPFRLPPVNSDVRAHERSIVNQDDVNRELENEMRKLMPLVLNSMVNQAVIRALVATHPEPDRVRQIAESILMQAQGTLALAGADGPRLPAAEVQRILDSIFKPPVQIQE